MFRLHFLQLIVNRPYRFFHIKNIIFTLSSLIFATVKAIKDHDVCTCNYHIELHFHSLLN